jgi:hypothetical protein
MARIGWRVFVVGAKRPKKLLPPLYKNSQDKRVIQRKAGIAPEKKTYFFETWIFLRIPKTN